MVSHELRTPLSLIVGTIEMMLRSENRMPLSEPYRQDARNIHVSAQHLSWLIGDVLDLASSQAGELRLTCKSLDLREVLDEAVLLSELIVQGKGLAWRTVIPQELPFIWGDRTRLRQVVLNLVSNAAKFTERGEVALNVEVGAQNVTLSVSDTGMGIPVDEQGTVFDEFRRSERAQVRGHGGMGLGLAITRRLVEMHGGQIGVRSAGVEGGGSTFYFTLPTLKEPPALPEPDPLRAQRVLFLTGRAGEKGLLRQYLVERGFDVEVLVLEETANWFAQVAAAPPGAIVLDYRPETERGWELLRLFRDSPTTCDVPVIFYALSEDLAMGSFFGADHLTKPVGARRPRRGVGAAGPGTGGLPARCDGVGCGR